VTNTVIVDYKGFRVGCNSPGNVIITTPFYVHQLGTLGDDGSYLKASLWPLLEDFSSSSNVSIFREYFPSSFLEAKLKVPEVCEGLAGFEVGNDGSSKGTSGPHGSML
jgi:hypothetical protein